MRIARIIPSLLVAGVIPLAARASDASRWDGHLDGGVATSPLGTGVSVIAGVSLALNPTLHMDLDVSSGPELESKGVVSIPENRLSLDPSSRLITLVTGPELRGPQRGSTRTFAAALAGVAHAREGDTHIQFMNEGGTVAPGKDWLSLAIGGSVGIRGVPGTSVALPRIELRALGLPGIRDGALLLSASLGVAFW